MGKPKKSKTGIYVGHVDEDITILLAQQLEDFRHSDEQGGPPAVAWWYIRHN